MFIITSFAQKYFQTIIEFNKWMSGHLDGWPFHWNKTFIITKDLKISVYKYCIIRFLILVIISDRYKLKTRYINSMVLVNWTYLLLPRPPLYRFSIYILFIEYLNKKCNRYPLATGEILNVRTRHKFSLNTDMMDWLSIILSIVVCDQWT